MVTIYIAIVCSKLPIPSHFKDFNVSVQIIFFLVLKSMFNRVKIQDVFINTSSLFIRKNTRITKHFGGNLIFFSFEGLSEHLAQFSKVIIRVLLSRFSM